MTRHRFRLLNVFADARFSGNALCVFEDGSSLTDAQMQALALQFNLSETTFLVPSTVASARVRIFTPSFEMPFAGHPTLGSAHVVRALHGGGDSVTLEMKAGIIPVTASGDIWTLEANSPRVRPLAATHSETASMLGLREHDIGKDVMWVNTGVEQLIVPASSPSAVDRCQPDPRLLARHASNAKGDALVLIWAWEGAREGERTGAHDAVSARFFFLKHGTLVEDPGTGSACANLGGWLVETKAALPRTVTIRQGEQTGRPCRLGLRVDEGARIFVTGNVIEVGSGEIVGAPSSESSRDDPSAAAK